MRKVILLLASMAAAVLLATGVALATSVDEAEPNNSRDQAQNIAADKFSLEEDINITDSTTVPHATISGTGNWTTDYYSFSVPEAGLSKVSVFDLDEASSFRTELRLYDSEGNDLASSSDGYSYNGVSLDPGSTQIYESYLKYEFLEAGTYYIEVSDWSYNGPIPSPGASYKLHVSIPGVDSAPPTVASVTPTSGKTGVPRNTNITATFSEEMDEASVEGAGVFTLKKKGASGTVDATVDYDPNTKTLTLDPASRLGKSATYTATITTQAQDAADNALSEQKNWTFRTKR